MELLELFERVEKLEQTQARQGRDILGLRALVDLQGIAQLVEERDLLREKVKELQYKIDVLTGSVDEEAKELWQNLTRPITQLDLSTRNHNAFKNAGINTVRDLVIKSDDQILRTKNFGHKSMPKLKDAVSKMGLRFGMSLSELKDIQRRAKAL